MAGGFAENQALLLLNGLDVSLRVGQQGSLVVALTSSSAGPGAVNNSVLELTPMVARAVAHHIFAFVDRLELEIPASPLESEESEEGPGEGF